MNAKTQLFQKGAVITARAIGKLILEIGTVFGILFVAFASSGDTKASGCRACDDDNWDTSQQSDWY